MAEDYAERMIKGSLVVFFLAAISMVIGYLLRIFLSRNLSIEDFGLFYAILAFVGIFKIFQDSGFTTTLPKFISDFLAKNMKRKIRFSIGFTLLSQLIIGATVTIIILFFANYIAISLFHTTEAFLPLVIILLSFFISIFMLIFQAVFRGFGNMLFYSSIEPLRLVVISISVYSLIHLGVVGVAYSYLIAPIVVSLIALFLLYKKIKIFTFRGKITAKDSKLKKTLLLFSAPIFVSSFGGIALSNIDTIAITMSRSLTEVGLYQVAMPTSQWIWIFVTCLTPMVLPIFSELWAKRAIRTLSSSLSLMVKLCFIGIIPAALILISFPDIIIRVMFGETYLAAVPALQILTLGSIFYTITILLVTVLVALGEPSKLSKTLILMAFLAIILNFSLVPSLGIIGASIAFTTSSLTGLLFSIYSIKKVIRLSVPWLPIIKSFIGGFITLMIIIFCKDILVLHPYLEVFICSVIGFLFYLLFITYTRTITRNDLNFLKRIRIPIPNLLVRIVLRFLK